LVLLSKNSQFARKRHKEAEHQVAQGGGQMKMSKTFVMPLILALCLAFVRSDAAAGETVSSGVQYFAAGLLLADVGASVANGFALTSGTPNRLNGYFGVVAGIISLGFVAVDFAATDDQDIRDSFALVFGTAGTASLVLGTIAVRRSPTARENAAETSGVRLFPYLTKESDRRYGMGVGAQVAF
jgi:hypothetical protein